MDGQRKPGAGEPSPRYSVLRKVLGKVSQMEVRQAQGGRAQDSRGSGVLFSPRYSFWGAQPVAITDGTPLAVRWSALTWAFRRYQILNWRWVP